MNGPGTGTGRTGSGPGGGVGDSGTGPGGGTSGRPVEDRLRRAFAARAESIALRDLRPAAPPARIPAAAGCPLPSSRGCAVSGCRWPRQPPPP